MNRKFGVIILAIIAVLCLSFGACNIGSGSTGGTVMTKEEALRKYIFEHEDSLVSEEFTLPSKIGGYRATWTSDNEHVVLEKRTDDYLATPVLPEEGQVSVNLTVDLRGVSDTYTVRVKAITAQDIADNYTFRQDKQIVYESFDLDLVASYKGKAADVTWSVVSGSNISIGEDGDECIVVPSSLSPTVSVKAEFSYKGEVATKVYTFTVSEEMEHLQQVNYWYTNTGVSITMKGYVVEIATKWSSSYNNVSLYMVDENLDAGYYLYRVSCDAANAALLQPGVYVTAEGTTNTNYNGLIETSAGGTLTVDASKTIDLDETVYALDNDLIANDVAAKYNQSRLVSLNGWKVKSASESAPSAGSAATLFTLEKDGATVSVAISKYLEGVYSTAKTDPVWSDLVTLYNTVKTKIDAEEDVYVNVKGVLSSYNNAAQILPLSASDVEIVSAETENTVGTKVKSAIAKVDEAFGKIPAVVAVDGTKSYELYSDATVEISYRLIGARSTIELTEADGKKALKFTPDFAEVANIDVTFTLDDYVTHKFYSVRAEKLDDKGKADWEIKNFVVETEITAAGEVNLPDTSFFEEASVVWTSSENFAIVKGNVLSVSLPLTIKVLKLTATVTVGEATATRDYYVKVPAYEATKYVYAEDAPEAGTYKALVVEQKNLSKTLYATASLNTNHYMETTTELSKAATVILTKVDGGYTIQLDGKYFEIAKVEGTDSNGNAKIFNNIQLNESATEGFVWTWNSDNKTFVTTLGSDTLYVGSYNKYETFSASLVKYISSSFPSKLLIGTSTATAQDILDDIVANIPTSATKDFDLDFKGAYTIEDGSNGIELDGLTAKVTQTAEDQTATLIVSVTYGKDSDGNPVVATKEVVITIPALTVTPDPVTKPAPEVGTYVLKMEQTAANKTVYAKDANSSYYIATTETIAEASTVVLSKVTGGYTIKLGDSYLEVEVSGTHNNAVRKETATSGFVWVWNETYGIMTCTISSGTFFLGNYSNFTTLSACALTRITGSNEGALGTTQFAFYLVASTSCDHNWGDGEVTTAPTCTEEGVKTYTCSKCSLTKTESIAATGHKDEDGDNVCDVCNAPLAETGDENYETKTLAEFVALADDNTKFYKIEGVIVNIANTQWGNIYITDGGKTIYVYGLSSSKMLLGDSGFTNPQDFNTLNLEVGMHVVLISAKGSWNNTVQAVGSGLYSSSDCSDLEMLYVAQYNVKVSASVNADFTLPSYEGVTITWTSDNSAIAINGTSATVTQSETEQTVTLTAVYTYLTATTTVTYTVKVPAKISGDVSSLSFNFVDGKDISDWSSWGSSYGTHEVNVNGVSIKFENTNKQNSGTTIDDRPVFNGKNGPRYLTVNTGSREFTSVTFDLKAWKASEKCSSLVVEYLDAEGNWKKACEYTGDYDTISFKVTATFAATTQVRLVATKGNYNARVGVSGIELTLA